MGAINMHYSAKKEYYTPFLTSCSGKMETKGSGTEMEYQCGFELDETSSPRRV